MSREREAAEHGVDDAELRRLFLVYQGPGAPRVRPARTARRRRALASTAIALLAGAAIAAALLVDRADRVPRALVPQAKDCASVVHRGVRYDRRAIAGSPKTGRLLGQAAAFGCTGVEEAQVRVAVIEGVDPRAAVMLRGTREAAYVAGTVCPRAAPSELLSCLRRTHGSAQ